MKRTTMLSTYMVLYLTLAFQLSTYAQMRGSGNLVREEREATSFNAIDVAGGIDLLLSQGGSQSVAVEAEDNLLELIITEVRGNTLYVYTKPRANIRRTRGMNVYITATEIEEISVSGGGDVESQSTIRSESLSFKVTGGGDLEFDFESQETSCHVSGGGDVELTGSAGDLKVSLSGGGDLDFRAGLANMDASLSGGGGADIKTAGRSGNIKIICTGGGDVDLDADAEKLITRIGGGGDAEIDAGSDVTLGEISVSGGGDLSLDMGVEKLMLNISGGGNARASGQAGNMVVRCKSGSDLDASGMEAVNAKVTLTGGADARLLVTGKLDVSASGGGNVYVSGNPEIQNADLSGGSKIHQR